MPRDIDPDDLCAEAYATQARIEYRRALARTIARLISADPE